MHVCRTHTVAGPRARCDRYLVCNTDTWRQGQQLKPPQAEHAFQPSRAWSLRASKAELSNTQGSPGWCHPSRAPLDSPLDGRTPPWMDAFSCSARGKYAARHAYLYILPWCKGERSVRRRGHAAGRAHLLRPGGQALDCARVTDASADSLNLSKANGRRHRPSRSLRKGSALRKVDPDIFYGMRPLEGKSLELY